MSDTPTDPWGNPIPEGQRPPQQPAPPPADADAGPPPGWWQASDGRWYPPQAAPGAATSEAPTPPPPDASTAGGGGTSAPVREDWWGAPAPGDATVPTTGAPAPVPPGTVPPGAPGTTPPGAPPGHTVPTATGGWVQPPPGWGGWVGPPKRDGLAVGSLVMSILAILCTGVIGIFLGTAGAITGFLSRKRIRDSQGALTGEGLATAGFIIGIIATVISVAFFVYITFVNPDLLQDILDDLSTTTTTP